MQNMLWYCIADDAEQAYKFTLFVELPQSMCNCLWIGVGGGGGGCAITTNRAWCFQIIDVKMPAVIHYCNLNVARGRLVSNLILELSNKRLSIMQLGILLCQPAVQSF